MSQEQDDSRPSRRKRPRRQPEFDPVARQYGRRIRYEVEEIPIVEESVDEIKGDEDSPHIILKFSLNTEEREIYDRIWNVPLLRHRTFNWELLGTLGQTERVRNLLGPRWATILEFDKKQYVELVREFYATFRHKTGDFNDEHAVSFSLGRQLFEMSVPRFAVLTGMYTEEEVLSHAFTESVRGYCKGTRRYWITAVDLATFWSTIAEGPHSSNAVASAIRDPVHKYIHRVIASTFVGRHSGHDKCSNLDLLCLYNIIGQHGVNLATLLLSCMNRAVLRPEAVSARLPLGPIISQIATSLGVFEKYSNKYLTLGPDTEVVSVADARKAGICTYDDSPRLVEARVLAGLGSSSQRYQIERPLAQPRIGAPRPTRLPPQPQPLTLEYVYERQLAMHEESQTCFRALFDHLQVPMPDCLRPSSDMGGSGYAEQDSEAGGSGTGEAGDEE